MSGIPPPPRTATGYVGAGVAMGFEVYVGGDGASPILITCEHASNALPVPWPDDDAWITDTHWAWDPGAAAVAKELADALGAVTVLATFSRLWCDANRDVGDPSMFRDVAEGRPVRIGQADMAERTRRIDGWWRPYHAAIAERAAQPGRIVLSIHTFTPVYEGEPREVEVGVLYDRADDLAIDWSVALTDRGLTVWLNEPYSGKEGLIFSAEHHAWASGREALELEIRNDLASDPAWRAANVPKIAAALFEAMSIGVR